MDLYQLGGSLLAILALAGIARWLRLGESRIDSPATACRFAEEALVAFKARAALVGTDGAGAVVVGSTGLALVKRHGAQVAVRRLVAPLRLTEAVEGVTIDSGERMFGTVTLFGVLADEVRRLEASLTSV